MSDRSHEVVGQLQSSDEAMLPSFDISVAQDFMLYVFGGPKVDQVYELTPTQLHTAADLIWGEYASRLEDSVLDLELDEFLVRNCLNGVTHTETAEKFWLTKVVVKNRVFKLGHKISDILPEADREQLFADIMALPEQPLIDTDTVIGIGQVALSTESDPDNELNAEPMKQDLVVIERNTSDTGNEQKPTRRRQSGSSEQVSGGDDMDLLRIYLRDIGKYKLLTKADEVRLSKLIQEGLESKRKLDMAGEDILSADRRALNRHIKAGEVAKKDFANANLRLVVSLAKMYQRSGMPLLDLIQEGNLGLLHAVDKFDWQKGFKFSTYATWWIRQALQRGIESKSRVVRVPSRAGHSIVRLTKARSQLEQELGRSPTSVELATTLELTSEEVNEILTWARVEPDSLDTPIKEDSTTTRGDMIGDPHAVDPEEAAIANDLPAEVHILLDKLNPREKAVVDLRFGLSDNRQRSFEEIGEHFSLTSERIRQILGVAEMKMRGDPNAERYYSRKAVRARAQVNARR